MAKRYDRMTPAEQREFDEIEIAILRLRDEGFSYTQIQKQLRVSPSRVAKTIRNREDD